MGLLSETWDFVRELPDENLPQLHGGAVQVISTPATPELRAYTRALAERADLCRARARLHVYAIKIFRELV